MLVGMNNTRAHVSNDGFQAFVGSTTGVWLACGSARVLPHSRCRSCACSLHVLLICVYMCVCGSWQPAWNNQASLQWIGTLSRSWLKGDLVHINTARRSISSLGRLMKDIIRALSSTKLMNHTFPKLAQFINGRLSVCACCFDRGR